MAAHTGLVAAFICVVGSIVYRHLLCPDGEGNPAFVRPTLVPGMALLPGLVNPDAGGSQAGLGLRVIHIAVEEPDAAVIFVQSDADVALAFFISVAAEEEGKVRNIGARLAGSCNCVEAFPDVTGSIEPGGRAEDSQDDVDESHTQTAVRFHFLWGREGRLHPERGARTVCGEAIKRPPVGGADVGGHPCQKGSTGVTHLPLGLWRLRLEG